MKPSQSLRFGHWMSRGRDVNNQPKKHKGVCHEHDISMNHTTNTYEVTKSLGQTNSWRIYESPSSFESAGILHQILKAVAWLANLFGIVEHTPNPVRKLKINEQTACDPGQMRSKVNFLHENSLAHRDIKPANLLLSGRQWKLCDFNLVA